ncbi:MAG TPA: non-canonical purine NTP pyrophosphatase, partial [Plesiomonas shigelloides]|nr:non-canonical purine NTP pyrophosphatase [Plesiomonas shigelloides]
MQKAQQKVVLATGNKGKVREMADLLAAFGLDVVAQSEFGIDSAEETGLTFIENAILKARHASRLTGLPAIADDSGLSVDCLGGAPGLYSARYAGENASDEENL